MSVGFISGNVFWFSEKTNGNTKLSVWSFTDEMYDFINAEGYGYKATHQDVGVECTLIPTEQFPSNLIQLLQAEKVSQILLYLRMHSYANMLNPDF